MTVNQSLVQQTVRNIAGTAGSYNSDWSAMFDQFSIASGDWNGRQLAWINTMLGTSYTDLPGARAAYAAVMGATNWDSLPGVYTDILDADLITATRAGATATYFDNTGALQTAAANTLRFDHDPVTRAFRGLLAEPAATNLLVRSNEFSNASWTKIAVTIETGITGIDGVVGSLVKIVPNTSNTNHFISQTLSFVNGTTYSTSFYAAKGEYKFARLSFPSQAFPAASRAVCFDLDAGTVAAIDAGVTAAIEPAGGGIYRITLTALANASASPGVGIALTINTTATTGLSTFAGDGSGGFYAGFSGMQATNIVTSHIPTVAASVTRNADNCLISGAAFSSIWPATEGTVYSEFEVRSVTAAANRMLFDASNVAGTERVVAYVETTGAVRYEVTAGGVTSVSQSPGSVVLGVNKFAAAFKANDCQCALNGVASAVDASATLPTGADGMGVGVTRSGSSQLIGWIKSKGIVPLRVPENGLIGLTA